MHSPDRGDVLLLQSSTGFGGSGRSLIALAKLLRDSGYRPVVACSQPAWLTDQLDASEIPWIKLPFFAWRKFLQRFRVRPAIRNTWIPSLAPWNFQLVHSNEFWWAPHAILLARRRKIPALVHLRDGHHTLKKARQYCVHDANLVLAVSTDLKDQFAADPKLFGKTEVVFNAHDEVATDPEHRLKARAAFGLQPNELVVGNIGHLCERKNQCLLLQVAATLRGNSAIPEFKIIFAGDADPPYRERLLKFAAELGLSSRVVLLGPVADIGNVFAAVDVVAHCARREGLPRVIPEAMLAHRPVVTTAAQGARDAIPNDRHGFIVPIDDAEAMARELARLLRESGLRTHIANQAYQRASDLFTPAALRERIVALYDRLVARSNCP